MWEAKSARPVSVHTQLMEYALMIEPDRDTVQKIAEVQEEIRALPGMVGRGICPHITLATFQAKEMMEEVLVRWIQNICLLEPSFEIRLNNFSGHPSHSIFVRIQDTAGFSGLVKRLGMIDTFVQANECPPIHFGKPGLSIAEGLPEALYSPVLTHFASECFSASFSVHEILLVRRWWEGEPYETVRRFRLAV